ncbi:MAG: serine/threonine protein kinase [Deltaproteobacteria bacterium]|nr:serine/threonine protein kinase [Deltaproteobacteria bacterium]
MGPLPAADPNEDHGLSILGEIAEDPGLVGQVVAGRYRVLKKMGEGGMGTVYLAEHMAIEKKVALKVLLQEYARKQDLKERFLQEAKAAARIGHENIVDITDFGTTPDGSVFFAMEFLEGRDLSQVIRKDGPMAWARAKPILLQICRALGAAHSKEIIHRDMKPENIYLIEREGRRDFAKLLDFGIAKVAGVGDSERRLTRTGMIFGTPEYMSPEQAQGHKPDHRVDIYAVGVIMYEMLTGEVPFKADTFMGILTKHIFEQPVPPTKLKPTLGIPGEVEAIVLKAMSKDREERFRSMAEMAAAIAQASGRMTRPTGDSQAVPRIMTPLFTATSMSPSESLPALPATTTDVPEVVPSSRGKILAILGVLVVLGGGVAAWALWPPRSAGPEGRGVAGGGPGTGTSASRADAAAGREPGSGTAVASGHADARAAVVPSEKTLDVTVDSTPQQAEIYMGETSLGLTPKLVRLPLTEGARSIMLTLRKKGYLERKVVVALADRGKTIAPTLAEEKHSGRTRPRDPGRQKTRPSTPSTDPKPGTGEGIKRTNDLMNPFE